MERSGSRCFHIPLSSLSHSSEVSHLEFPHVGHVRVAVKWLMVGISFHVRVPQGSLLAPLEYDGLDGCRIRCLLIWQVIFHWHTTYQSSHWKTTGCGTPRTHWKWSSASHSVAGLTLFVTLCQASVYGIPCVANIAREWATFFQGSSCLRIEPGPGQAEPPGSPRTLLSKLRSINYWSLSASLNETAAVICGKKERGRIRLKPAAGPASIPEPSCFCSRFLLCGRSGFFLNYIIQWDIIGE